MEGSRRDLFNDMAEHMPLLKNSQHTYYPRFGFTPKTDNSLKRGFLFTVFEIYSPVHESSKHTLL